MSEPLPIIQLAFRYLVTARWISHTSISERNVG